MQIENHRLTTSNDVLNNKLMTQKHTTEENAKLFESDKRMK